MTTLSKDVQPFSSSSVLDTLVSLLTREYPDRAFDSYVSEDGQQLVREIHPETGAFIRNFFEFSVHTMAIRNAKPWKDKKIQVLNRTIADEASQLNHLPLQGGWLGAYLGRESFSDFQYAGFEQPVYFLSQTVRRIFRELESMNGLFFSLIHSGNLIKGVLDGSSFQLRYFFETKGIRFELLAADESTKKIASKDAHCFYLSYGNEHHLKHALSKEVRSFRLKKLFAHKSESFVYQRLKENVFSKFPEDLLFQQQALAFLCTQLAMPEKELDTLFLNSPNPPKMKNKVALGSYRFSFFPNPGFENIVFSYSPYSKSHTIIESSRKVDSQETYNLYLYQLPLGN